jgi:hypothetical protein
MCLCRGLRLLRTAASRILDTPMPVPPLVKAGLLPVGIHSATLSEIEQAFGLANEARIELFKNLRIFCDELGVFGTLIKAIFVDGSFVTSKPVPGDIDLVVVHDEGDFWRSMNIRTLNSSTRIAHMVSTSSTSSSSLTRKRWYAPFRRSRPSLRLRTVSPPDIRRASFE